ELVSTFCFTPSLIQSSFTLKITLMRSRLTVLALVTTTIHACESTAIDACALSAPTCFSLFVQLKFRPQSLHEPPLARQLVPQKASGNGSLPGASLRYWLSPRS